MGKPASLHWLHLAQACFDHTIHFVQGSAQQWWIKVIEFDDANRNGTWDRGEAGLQEQVGISQDVTGPAQSQDLVTFFTPEPIGEALFEALEPGKYCISHHGELLPTSKLAFEVLLSSDQELAAWLGLTENLGSGRSV